MVGTDRSIRTPRTSKFTQDWDGPDEYRFLHESHEAVGRRIQAANSEPDGSRHHPSVSSAAVRVEFDRSAQTTPKTGRQLERINSITTMFRPYPKFRPDDLRHSWPHS